MPSVRSPVAADAPMTNDSAPMTNDPAPVPTDAPMPAANGSAPMPTTDAPRPAANGSAANGSAPMPAANDTAAETPEMTPPTTTVAPTTTASTGPSTGPPDRRLLLDSLFQNERKLQANSSGNSSGDNSSGLATANVTADTTGTATETEVCPPCVTTTFATVFTFAEGADLSSLDFDVLANNLKTAESWDADVDVEVEVTFTNSFSLTFAAGSSVDDTQCATAVANAFNVELAQVTCEVGTAEAATAGAATDATAENSTNSTERRLQDVVMNVAITSTTGSEASTTATLAGESGTLTAMGTELGVDAPAASPVVTTADVTFTVMSSEDLADIDAATLVAQMDGQGFTVTATAPVKNVLASDSCSTFTCVSGTPHSNAATLIGSTQAICCVAQATQNGARSKSVLGSLTFLALSHNFLF